MLKTLHKISIGKTYLTIVNAMYDKTTANIILSDEKVKVFLLQEEGRVPTLTTISQHSSGTFNHSNHKRKNKSNLVWKRRSKTLSLCR